VLTGILDLSDDRSPDENKDKPKTSLFKRLFGRAEPQTAPEESVESSAPVAPASEAPAAEPPAAEPEVPEAPAETIIEADAVSEVDTVFPAGETAITEPAAAPEPAKRGWRLFGRAEPKTPQKESHETPTAETASQGEETAVEPPKRNWWTRLREGLARSSSSIGTGLVEIFTKRKLDEAMLEDLEDILIRSDLGIAAASRITKAVGKGRYDKTVDVDDVKAILAAEVEQVLAPFALPLVIDPSKKPFVILIVGVNGSGKTTTIGKLALKFTQEGKNVMLAAGDTFRAAAIEQLRIWGERLGCEVIARDQGSDAAGLAFDAIKAAQAQQADVLLMDTAGRLQNRTELMAELEKIIRVMKKIDASAPHAVLLVLDATVGQNAMTQVEIFGRVAGVTGLVMTKLDGTARGGILVAVTEKFQLPVHFIGVGETAEDLESFEARDFARAIAGIEDRAG